MLLIHNNFVRVSEDYFIINEIIKAADRYAFLVLRSIAKSK